MLNPIRSGLFQTALDDVLLIEMSMIYRGALTTGVIDGQLSTTI